MTDRELRVKIARILTEAEVLKPWEFEGAEPLVDDLVALYREEQSALQTLLQQWRGDAKEHGYTPWANGFSDGLESCADALEALIPK